MAVSLHGVLFPLPPNALAAAHVLPAAHNPAFPALWAQRTEHMEFVHCDTTAEAEARAKSGAAPEVVATCWIDDSCSAPDPEVLLAIEPGGWAEYGLREGDPVHELVTEQSVFPMIRPWIPRKTHGKVLGAFVSMHMRTWVASLV